MKELDRSADQLFGVIPTQSQINGFKVTGDQFKPPTNGLRETTLTSPS